MSREKRLLVVSSFAESLVNFRLALMQDAMAEGYEVHACAPDFDEDISATLTAAGIAVHSIKLSRNGLNPFGDLLTLYSIWRLVRKIKPTHQLAYTIKPVIYGTLAAWLGGVKRVGALVTGLGYAFMQADSKRQKWIGHLAQMLYKIALWGADVVFFQNPDDQGVFIDNRLVRADKTRIVNGSGIDIHQFTHTPMPEKSTVKFLMICRILADKGAREYAAAAKRVSHQYPNSEFHLVGWLDSNPTAIQQHELDQWIKDGMIFHGKLADVRDVIAASHVYVLPSYREGTPRTVLEAMAIGRAIITTDAPGCRETIRSNESGLLVEVANVDDLQNAMEDYLTHPDKIDQHALAARKRAEDVYDVKRVNQQMLRGLHG